jgi:succinyl-CoA synthetase beta subunit
MRLQEYQSKLLFAQAGIPIPRGGVVATPQEAYHLAAGLGQSVAVKAQVLIGGRGKAGGIRLASTPQEAEEAAAAILGMEVRGLPVRKLLVEEAVTVRQEIYLGLVIDRAIRRVVMMASGEGGVEIEQVARDHPDAIQTVVVDPLQGLSSAQALLLAQGVGVTEELYPAFDQLACKLYEVLTSHDAMLAEINPLVATAGGHLLALDAKMVVDDNALFRHPELVQLQADEMSGDGVGAEGSPGAETLAEREAREAGLSYVHLGGEIGCVVNGAGLAMATMDVIKLFGGVPANFLDVGGGADAGRVATAMRLVLCTAGIKAVLINIFGGITLCDEVARGIVAALDQAVAGQTNVPMVVRLVGTNEEQGHEILNQSGHRLIVVSTLAEAASKVVAVAGDEIET